MSSVNDQIAQAIEAARDDCIRCGCDSCYIRSEVFEEALDLVRMVIAS